MSQAPSLRQPENVSTAEWCRQNDIEAGAVLAGDDGYGLSKIRVTAIGETSVMARLFEHAGRPITDEPELPWVLRYRDWQLAEPPEGTK